jgi:MoaA/NifB/PqqE/SkfB family radical SAM enzyme
MSSVTEVKTRTCDGCKTEVHHQMSGREAIEIAACPTCGGELLFSNFIRMDVALSEYCNLKCQMCRRPSEALFMDAERVKRGLTEAVAVGVQYLSFSGGEPFVHPQILEILDHAISLGVKVQMVSNGTLIREKHLDLLRKLDCLTLSVDGTESAHDHIRRRPGTYQRTLKTIRLLTEKSDIQWGTNTVMQRDNHHCLYDSWKTIQDIGAFKYAYCGFSHVEVVPETTGLQMSPAEAEIAHAQLVRIEKECARTHTHFNDREMLLLHFDTYARKEKRYRPIDGCKIPQKFIGFSDHGFYLCWHQGRNIQAESLIEALKSELARDIVREGLEKRCVACNCFNYSWDAEWNRGIMESASRGENVERGVVALRVPSRLKFVAGGSDGNTLDLHEI